MQADNTLAFLAVCEHGSFQAAGDALGLANTTVSRRVAQLEEHLGVPLLERSTRGLELTEAGRVYRDASSGVSRALSDARDAVREVMAHPAGRMRVAAPSGMVRSMVGDAAIAYRQRYPDVSLEILSTLRELVPDGETLHVAIWISNRVPPENLISRTLGRFEVIPCASPAYLEKHPIETLEDLSSRSTVMLSGDPSQATFQVRTATGIRDVTVPLGLHTTSVSLARRAVLAGLGPSGIPAPNCIDLLATGKLVRILPDVEVVPVPVRVLYVGKPPPLRVRAFIDAVVEAYDAWSASLPGLLAEVPASSR